MSNGNDDEVIEAATALFEDQKELALQWLDEPARALGDITPRQAVIAGRRNDVLRLIGQIEEGIVP